MSLLLNGAKTVTIAGTEMSCIEIYTGEAYTFPFTFTDAGGIPINCTSWTLATQAKWYTCTVTYPTLHQIFIANLALDVPQPSAGASTGLTAAFTNAALGEGYIYVPNVITGGYGTPNPSPTPTVTDTTSILVILTLSVTRTDGVSGFADINREPIGMLVRYQ